MDMLGRIEKNAVLRVPRRKTTLGKTFLIHDSNKKYLKENQNSFIIDKKKSTTKKKKH